MAQALAYSVDKLDKSPRGELTQLPPETVFHWRLDGLTLDSFAGAGPDEEWRSPPFLACGLRWHVRVVPNVVADDGNRYAGVYLYLETPDATCWPAVAEISISDVTRRLLKLPFSTKRPAPDGASRNWGVDHMAEHYELLNHLCRHGNSLTVTVRLRARAFNELELPHRGRPTSGALSDDLVALLAGGGPPTDVQFRCSGGEKIGAHSLVLAARSTALRALLHGPLATKLPAELGVPDCIGASTMERLVTFMYTDEVYFRSFEEAQHLLFAADYYDVPRLRAYCEIHLHTGITLSNALETLVLAHACNCVRLRDSVLRFMAQHAGEMQVAGSAWDSLREMHPELAEAILYTAAHGEPPPRVLAREAASPTTMCGRRSTPSPEVCKRSESSTS